LGLTDALENTINRIKLYDKAGADGIFVPCVVSSKDIKRLVNSTKLPINIMTMPSLSDFDTLQSLGVKRVSQGGFLYNNLIDKLEKQLQTISADKSFKSLF
jgi:2-methylisocitrate lyase-like PEP mutase family enzyme